MDQRSRKALLRQLRLQCEMVCESNKDKQDEVLDRLLVTVLSLRDKRGKKADLVRILESCGYEGETAIAVKGDMIYVSGTFFIPELARSVVWGSGREQLEEGE